MRMWMVDPKILCNQHLAGEHVELHMFAGHLLRGKRVDGYARHNCIEPWSIQFRHDVLAAEMLARGWNHNSPLSQPHILIHQHPEATVDREASLAELLNRCVHCRARSIQN